MASIETRGLMDQDRQENDHYKLEENAFTDRNSMDLETDTSPCNGIYDSKTANEDRPFPTRMDSSYGVPECLNARIWTNVY